VVRGRVHQVGRTIQPPGHPAGLPLPDRIRRPAAQRRTLEVRAVKEAHPVRPLSR
jgi:hypothetical protein